VYPFYSRAALPGPFPASKGMGVSCIEHRKRKLVLKILHLLHSEPDDIVIDLIAAISGNHGATVVSLYPDDVAQIPVDWPRVVDDVMAYDTIICWW
jgi:hypothetical protein